MTDFEKKLAWFMVAASLIIIVYSIFLVKEINDHGLKYIIETIWCGEKGCEDGNN